MNSKEANPCLIFGKELGTGSFSDVFSATFAGSTTRVAVKCSKGSEGAAMLCNEVETMQLLAGCKCVPQLIDASHVPDCIVMEEVGQTLLSLKEERGDISLKSVVMVAIKAITALEEIHSCGFIHKDIKPDNIAVSGKYGDPRIVLLDFGFSCKHSFKGMHVQFSEKWRFQGTPFFCSTNALAGMRPSRRDDLEALGYVLVFLCKGELPWFLSLSTPDFTNEILLIRSTNHPTVLCKDLEPEFTTYLNYCQALRYSETPDYEMLRRLFIKVARRKGFALDWVYDWTPKHVRAEKSASVRWPKSTAKRERVKRAGSRPHLFSENEEVKSPEKDSPPVLPVPLCGLSISQSTGENTPIDDQSTPVHSIDKLPAFHWPRGACICQVPTLILEFSCKSPPKHI